MSVSSIEHDIADDVEHIRASGEERQYTRNLVWCRRFLGQWELDTFKRDNSQDVDQIEVANMHRAGNRRLRIEERWRRDLSTPPAYVRPTYAAPPPAYAAPPPTYAAPPPTPRPPPARAPRTPAPTPECPIQ
jgi:hypothetical protein